VRDLFAAEAEMIRPMRQENTTLLELLIALRTDEERRLENVLATDFESPVNKSLARARLAILEQDDAADLRELERLGARA